MLVGREEELQSLNNRLDALDSAGGSVILIRGEAGIGKSSLVREFTDQHKTSAKIYCGWCDDLMTPQPMGPFRDIARGEPSLLEPLKAGDRLGVMEATLDLLCDQSQANIVVLEDTHWADDATFDAIKYLGRRSARSNGLLILTYRDGEVDHDHPLRGVVGELPANVVKRIHLGRLATDSIAALLDNTDLELDKVMALTDGNPLFVSELLATGIEHVPSSVRDGVLARAAKLSPKARRLLDLVSIAPGETEQRVIDNILAPTYSQMAECERQGLLLVLDKTISFGHELARRAIESVLDEPTRRDLNYQFMNAITEDENWAQLVHHSVEAQDRPSTANFALRAANAAMEIESYREAAAHFRTLNAHLDLVAEPDRAGLLEDWSRVEFFLGTDRSLQLAARSIELRREHADQRALALTLAFAVNVAENNGEPATADSYSSEAIEILEKLEPSGDLAFALNQQAWLRLMRGDDDVLVWDLASRAIKIATVAEDELRLVQALSLKGSVGENHRKHGQGSILEEALARAEVAGFKTEEAYALILLASTAADNRDIDRAADFVKRARATAARYEIRHFEQYAEAMHAEILLWQGDWDAAEDLAVEALNGRPNSKMVALRILGSIQSRRGNSEADATLDLMWSLARASGELQSMDPGAAVLAEHMWLSTSKDPKRLEQLHDVMTRSIAGDWFWPSGAFAFWMWKLDADAVPADHTWEFYRSVMTGDWQKEANLWESKGAPYERGLALMHGDTAAKIEAIEILETLGATATANRVRQDLTNTGVRPPRGRSQTTRDHAAGLTARQAEVLELLAQGFTNTSIADQLFVSLRTVENHVSAILMKFDVSGREDAVKAARIQGLLDST